MLVSALMPNYNHGHFLETKLTALLEAMPLESEILILDDASTDHSVSIIRKFAEQDPRIKFYRHSKNQGVFPSVVELLSYAQGTYIFPTAVDDVLLSAGMEAILSAIKTLPNAPLYFAENGVLYENGRIESTPLESYPSTTYLNPDALIRIYRQKKVSIPGQAVFIKREAMLRHGGYDLKLQALADWVLNHRIALTEGAVYVPCALSYWRLHEEGQYSKICLNDPQIVSEIFARFLETLSIKQLRSVFRRARLIPHFFHSHIWESAKKNPRHLDLALTLPLQKIERMGRRYQQSLKKLPRKFKNLLVKNQ